MIKEFFKSLSLYVFLNRNVSSEGIYSRKKLRECVGLIESVINVLKAAIGKNDIDNKAVENLVCLLRNLSYACQETVDLDYLDKRNRKHSYEKGSFINAFNFLSYFTSR